MKTIKLYDTDSMLRFTECTVLECVKSESGYKIILDKTVFFPQGGGQTADTGVIGNAAVLDVLEENGEIYHYTNSPLEEGHTYTSSINFDERFDKMQNHSGEHIVSGIVNKKYGYNNVGFHLSADEVTLDFDGTLTRGDLDEIEILANEAIHKNAPITAYYPDKDELSAIPYRSKLELTDNVRLVVIDGYDICACCAPHVKSTGDIGIIKLMNIEKHKNGVRIYMKCGMRAVKDYQVKYRNNAEISALLCARADETADAVRNLQNENERLKYEIIGFKRMWLDLKLESIPDSDGNICIIDRDITADDMRYCANKMVERCRVAGIFSHTDKGFSYVCASKHTDMREFGKKLNEALSGKGGGTAAMIQGSVAADEDAIIHFFETDN